MPRTKHVRKPKQDQEVAKESDLLIRDFERQAQMRILKMEAEGKIEIKSLETFIDLTLSRLPVEIRQMTIGDILNCDVENETKNCNEVSSSVNDCSSPLVSTTVKSKKTVKRITAASDDGYVTEGVATRTRTPRATKTTGGTRSTSRNNRIKLSKVNQDTVKKVLKKERVEQSTGTSKSKTPDPLKFGNNEYGLVTPKIKPNTPLNVLRRPRQGEVVLSMQGSPLLVSTILQEDTANINVPLSNGNIISLLPNNGLRISHIPDVDAEVKRQLETLKGHLEKVIFKNESSSQQ